MVKFDLFAETSDYVDYRYYPEGQIDSGFGIIRLNKVTGKTELIKLSAGDSKRVVTVQDQLKMRDSINLMRYEQGKPLLSDEEFPIKTSFAVYSYATHAANRIVDAYEKGEVIKSDTVMWY